VEVVIQGVSGHAAMPEKGVDALEAANAIISDLYAYRKTFTATRSKVAGITSPTLVIGLICGGINTNVVPDRVVFRLDRRVIPEENPARAESELVARIQHAAAGRAGISVSVKRILLAKPFVPLPGQERIVAAIQRHAKAVMGVDAQAHGVPLYTDARHYSEAGVPTVLYGAGPRTLAEANGHRADEKLVLNDLYQATEVVALTLAELLAPQA
jgi:acetylornithine deacetylase/succinyl-diaminopimelate desuccinylase-like protein